MNKIHADTPPPPADREYVIVTHDDMGRLYGWAALPRRRGTFFFLEPIEQPGRQQVAMKIARRYNRSQALATRRRMVAKANQQPRPLQTIYASAVVVPVDVLLGAARLAYDPAHNVILLIFANVRVIAGPDAGHQEDNGK